MDRWNDEQESIAERQRDFEKRVEALQQRNERVVAAYPYEGAINKETYQAHLARAEES